MKKILLLLTLLTFSLLAKQGMIKYDQRTGEPYCTYLLSDIDSITFFEWDMTGQVHMRYYLFGKSTSHSSLIIEDNYRVTFFELFSGDVTGGMKEIPAKDQTFTMGWSAINETEHEVTLTQNFYMDSTEITQLMYDQIMTASYSGYRSLTWGSIAGINNSGWGLGYGRGDSLPAYNVNWYDAILFCNARSKMAGLDTVYTYSRISGPGNDGFAADVYINYKKNGYRLPTEAEWEFACRGGTTTAYYWGDEDDTLIVSQYAWYEPNSDNDAHQVAQKKPNAYGLYDMHGNLFEWCNDWYGEYSATPKSDPHGASSGDKRSKRGGALNQPENGLYSAYRVKDDPLDVYPTCGFRTVLPIQ